MAQPLEVLAHPDEATRYLGKHLFEGSLALLLGAGISKPLGLPSWPELLDACFNKLGEPPYDGNDLELGATRLRGLCEERGMNLEELVRDNLYPLGGPAPKNLMRSPRMGALGAMVMGSRRGTVSEVFTFNFDSVLEEYLLLHGYVVNVITKLPALIGSHDVSIYHPHGYLPSESGPGVRTSEIILTKESINKMLGSADNPWVVRLRALIRSKLVMLIGISGKSAIGGAIGPILTDQAEYLFAQRPSAFWIGKDALETASGGLDPDVRRLLIKSNVVPVPLEHDQVDDFLLGICREAAKRMVC